MKMKALLIDKITSGDDVMLTDTDVPALEPGEVLIKVKAFGLNHSEQILRQGEINAPYIKKPVIPGIECIGEICESNGSPFRKGQMVAALMGGMGRNFNGSYAEYVAMPAHHVFGIKENHLSLSELAAVPETWFTAFGSLFGGLHLNGKDTLLIRGATCALGYTSIMIARAVGARVIATTHKEEKLKQIKDIEAVVDDGCLSEIMRNKGINKIFDLVGPKYLKDSMSVLTAGGFICSSGILGGESVIHDFYPITDIPNGVFLTSFYSNYPSQKNMDEILDFIEKYKLKPPVGRVFEFKNLKDAIRAQDSGTVEGKIVVLI